MPKVGLMAQISRPFQIALVALVLLAGVWLFALRGHSSAASSSESSAPTPAPAATSTIQHGTAPGVEGLSRAIAKAHGTVSASEQSAKQLEGRSSKGSGGTASPAGAATGAATTAAPAATATHAPAASTSLPAVHSKAASPSGHRTAPSVPSLQAKVEAELKTGNIVAILFWSSKGADDRAVRAELRFLAAVHRKLQPYAHNVQVQRLLKVFGLELSKKIAVHEASAAQVGSFGSITRGVQVYGTPTILVINKQGRVITLTGLTDAYAIEQAMDEARRG